MRGWRRAGALAVLALVGVALPVTAMAGQRLNSVSPLGHAIAGPLPVPSGEQFASGVGGVACPSEGACITAGSYERSSGASAMMVDTQSSGTWSTRPGTLPSNGLANDSNYLSGIACPTATTCDAVGTYTSTAASQSSTVVTIAGGASTGAIEVQAPSTDAGSAGNSDLSSIACASASSCTAVGGYSDLAGDNFGYVTNGFGSTWSQGVEIPMPSDAATNPLVTVGTVSCTSAGNCVVVGSYKDTSGDVQAFFDTITAGVPATAVEVTAPSGAATPADTSLTGVSCTAVGTCTAVGSALQSDDDFEPMYVQETSGTLGATQLVPAPSGGSSFLSGIDCATATTCTASGAFAGPSSSTQTVVVGLTSGTWGTPQVVSPPSLDSTAPDPSVGPITCLGSACTLIESVHQSQYLHAAVASTSNGTWSSAVLLPVPSTIGSKQYGTVGGVSCPSGSCEAVGVYLAPNEQDSSFAEAGQGAAWTAGTALETPPTLGSYTTMNAVSCASIGNCVAVGPVGGGSAVFTETTGTWGLGVAASSTVDVSGLAGISCPTVAWCLAVGSSDALIDQSGALSTLATPTIFGTGNAPETLNLQSVSCWSPGNCEAVGWYSNFPSTPNELAVAIVMQNGAWGTPVGIPAPADEFGTGMTQLFGVSCVGAGDCAAVGYAFQNQNGGGATIVPEFVESVGGAWQPSVAVSTATSDAALLAISCATSASCIAVGSEDAAITSAHAVYATGSVNGLGSTVEVVPPGGGLATSVTSQLDGISCWSATECVAVGQFINPAGQTVPMSVQSAPVASPPGKVVDLHLKSKTQSSLTIAWKAPTNLGAGSVHYRVSKSRNGRTWSTVIGSTTSTHATVSHLLSSTTYHLRVVVIASDGQMSPPVALKATTLAARRG